LIKRSSEAITDPRSFDEVALNAAPSLIKHRMAQWQRRGHQRNTKQRPRVFHVHEILSTVTSQKLIRLECQRGYLDSCTLLIPGYAFVAEESERNVMLVKMGLQYKEVQLD
jgi:hypothetical protein